MYNKIPYLYFSNESPPQIEAVANQEMVPFDKEVQENFEINGGLKRSNLQTLTYEVNSSALTTIS